MPQDPRINGGPDTLHDKELEWIAGHETELRQWVSGEHFLYWSLAIGLVLGLAAHIAGYVLGSWALSEPIELVADLLYALGIALWTGVVVVVFAQVIPAAKQRQLARYLKAYETEQRSRAAEDREGHSADDEGPRTDARPG